MRVQAEKIHHELAEGTSINHRDTEAQSNQVSKGPKNICVSVPLWLFLDFLRLLRALRGESSDGRVT